MSSRNVKDIAHIAMVAGLYVVLTITPPLNAISYGAYQFRLAEMLNFLAFYHKKYITAVTLGCMIANFFTYGWLDVIVGGGSTFIFVSLGVYLFSRYQNRYFLGGWLNQAFCYFSFFFAFSMFTIALELALISGLPFWATWLSTALGELASLLIGSVVMVYLAKRLDFTQ